MSRKRILDSPVAHPGAGRFRASVREVCAESEGEAIRFATSLLALRPHGGHAGASRRESHDHVASSEIGWIRESASRRRGDMSRGRERVPWSDSDPWSPGSEVALRVLWGMPLSPIHLPAAVTANGMRHRAATRQHAPTRGCFSARRRGGTTRRGRWRGRGGPGGLCWTATGRGGAWTWPGRWTAGRSSPALPGRGEHAAHAVARSPRLAPNRVSPASPHYAFGKSVAAASSRAGGDGSRALGARGGRQRRRRLHHGGADADGRRAGAHLARGCVRHHGLRRQDEGDPSAPSGAWARPPRKRTTTRASIQSR